MLAQLVAQLIVGEAELRRGRPLIVPADSERAGQQLALEAGDRGPEIERGEPHPDRVRRLSAAGRNGEANGSNWISAIGRPGAAAR